MSDDQTAQTPTTEVIIRLKDGGVPSSISVYDGFKYVGGLHSESFCEFRDGVLDDALSGVRGAVRMLAGERAKADAIAGEEQ